MIKRAEESYVEAYERFIHREDEYNETVNLMKDFEERFKSVHRQSRHAEITAEDLYQKHAEDEPRFEQALEDIEKLKGLVRIITRQGQAIEVLKVQLERAMRLIDVLSKPLLDSK